MNEIIIVCDGGCGKTTEDIPKDIPFGDAGAGEFEQIDESGVPKWTCADCLARYETRICKGCGKAYRQIIGALGQYCNDCCKLITDRATKAEIKQT